ncbi:MAG: VanW family protein [Clostridia bacterium]|nr:VanW family protein [Clostridia bacterium]
MAIVVAVLVLGSFALRLSLDISKGSGTFYEGVSVDGINLYGYSFEDAVTLVEGIRNEDISNKRITLQYENNTWDITPEMIGVSTDIDEQIRLAWQKGREGNIFTRQKKIRELKETPYAGKTSVFYDQEKLFAILEDIKKDIDLPATDATVTFDPSLEERFVFTEEADGREVNLDALKKQAVTLLDGGKPGTILIETNPIAPEVTYMMLRESTTRRSRATTELSASSTADRNFNIRKALDYFNGMVVKSGEKVSFNDIVGPRELKYGWKNAGQYVDDDVVDGPGGGICQASTTLYQAAVKAGLKIVERHKHSMPVNYIELKGTDASVSYGDKDFVFQNTTDYPIYIAASVSSSTVTVTIYGHSLEKEGIGSISMESEILETYDAPDPEIVKDSEGKYCTYTDETYNVRTSKAGYKVRTFRVYKDLDGKVIEDKREQLSQDTYKAIKGIVYVGVKTRPNPGTGNNG